MRDPWSRHRERASRNPPRGSPPRARFRRAPLVSIQSIAILIALFLIVKKLYSSSTIPQVHVHNERENIQDSVKDGVKSAIKELEYEKEEEELLIRSIGRKGQEMGVFSSVREEKPINSGGELIPAGLSDSEKEILRMFYNQ